MGLPLVHPVDATLYWNLEKYGLDRRTASGLTRRRFVMT
jgi:hypothetical protein